MTDRRDMPTSGSLSWSLPPGYHLALVRFRNYSGFQPYEVNVAYYAVEDSGLIDAFGNGGGDSFESALAAALEKVEAAVNAKREDLVKFRASMPVTPVFDLGQLTFEL